MTEDVERRLRNAVRAAELPEAPPALRARIHALDDAGNRHRARERRAWYLVLPATIAVVSAMIVVASGLRGIPPSSNEIGRAHV